MVDIGSPPVGAQLQDYAKQVAALNSQIDGLAKGGMLPEDGPGKATYETLRAQRDALTSKATGLASKAKKAGGGDLNFAKMLKDVGANPVTDGTIGDGLGDTETNANIDDAAKYTEFETGRAPAASAAEVVPAAVPPAAAPAEPKPQDNSIMGRLAQALAPALVPVIGKIAPDKPTPSKPLAEFRAQYPAYKDVPDAELAEGLRKKFYASMDPAEFYKKIEFSPGFPYNAPGKEYGAIVPLATSTKTGQVEIAAPEAVREVARGAITAGRKIARKQPIDLTRNEEGVFDKAVSPEEQMALLGTAGAGGAVSAGARNAAQRAVGPIIPDTVTSAVGRAVTDMPEKIVPAAVEGVKAAGKAIPNTYRRVMGKEAAEATENVRSGVLGRVEGALADEEATAAAATAQADKLGEKAGRLREATAERTNRLTAEYEAAGRSAEEARAAATQHAQLADDAKAAVEKLSTDLTAKPGLSKQDFGAQLAQTTRELQEKYTKKRADESGYTKAMEEAGDELVVDTAAAQKTAEHWLKKTVSLTDDPLLEKIKRKLATEADGVAHDKMTVAQADSLRKTLNEIVYNKVYGNSAVDSEVAKAVGAVRDVLNAAIDEATPALKAARKKWAELSGPLDIVYEKGPLSKVAEIKARSRDAQMAASEITGHIVREANAGHEVFTRLLAENPQLRDSARLYFSRDLFGDGKMKVPSHDAMQTWIKGNENSLRQLGLYDEFKSIPAAKAAAERAVKEATGAQKLSEGAAKLAEQRETSARKSLAEAQKRNTAVLDRVGKKKEEATKTATEAADNAREYKGFVTRLQSKTDPQVPATAKETAKKLFDAKRIDDKVYKETLEAIADAEAKNLSRDKLRQRIKNIIYTAAVAGGTYEGYRAVRAILD